ncbi:MAG TPA: zf-HC2 domain-containing protein [Vicinamibacterales bacterium]|jgi:anti-sigma factor RsiW|nr:zf-HC2 domain-containing protein [Vicinamibacterales bacterium]
MTAACAWPIADERLIDYWTGDLPATDGATLEEHLFSCADCSARLEAVASMAGGVAALARQGRISGIISRALLNRLQRDGVRVRQFTLNPGETVPCAAFPGDDVVVTSLNANLTGVHAVSLRVTGPGDVPVGAIDDIPVAAAATGVLWATPGGFVRSMPSQQLRLTLRATDGAGDILGEYVLDHTMNLEAD